MRYFLKINLKNSPVERKPLSHELLQKYLPVSKAHKTSQGIFLQTFRYESDDLGIIGANWDHPFFENDEYYLFIGGHVLNRLAEVNKSGKVVPSPEDVFKVIIREGDNHYHYLKGSYYILLFNKCKGTIIIYSSPMFLYPVFFTVKSDLLIFSNILEFILKELDTIEINKQGLVEFSLFDHPIGMNTIYKDVYSMTGGARIDLKENCFKETAVYDIAKWIHAKPGSRKETLPEINDTLNRVIENYTTNVKQFNISLTGGFDGRLNFAMIKPRDYKRLQAFSYGKSGSLQISIPTNISKKLGFKYTPVNLDAEFVERYAETGHEAILLTGGVTPFMRANYLYGYGKIKDFSRNCILGQCDMIRPLYNNPAGAIFNKYSHGLFYSNNFTDFLNDFAQLRENGFLNGDLFTDELAKTIYDNVRGRYIADYPQFNDNERFFLFLYKESIMKFWHTECHIVDLLVDDFISFADLDYLEVLASSEYFGLYKGIFATNQFRRRKAHDLYIDLMTINNNELNDIETDRLFKPKWLKYGLIGSLVAYYGKYLSKKRGKKLGNETFGGRSWSKTFYDRYQVEIARNSKLFNPNILVNKPYADDNHYRSDRHLSLKLWLERLGVN